ncbi:MAG: hypothetical protein QOC96_1017 [Acidobacteriota bacterium]|jgi:hypothetical protein|nr:hypothetical protein [Acidobacteriota bacterium]
MSLHYPKINSTFFSVAFLVCALLLTPFVIAQQRRAPEGGQRAVIVDERLAVLRDAPDLSANLLHRMSRGRAVAIRGARRAPDGVTFYRVVVTRRTGGWIQSEAVIAPARKDEDVRLLRLIQSSEDFDSLARARIFLDLFQRSPLRPTVLMLYGEEAEKVAVKLSRDANKRLDEKEMTANGAPVFSYFLNYNGLDRYRRQGIIFTFDRATKQFHYDGASWREIVRRYPHSPEAAEARKRLDALSTTAAR